MNFVQSALVASELQQGYLNHDIPVIKETLTDVTQVRTRVRLQQHRSTDNAI